MSIFIATFYLCFLLSHSPQCEAHRKHLLQFAPAPDASISFVPTASPSEIPSNPPLPSSTPSSSSPPLRAPKHSYLSPPLPTSKPPASSSPLPSPTPPDSSPPLSSPTPPVSSPPLPSPTPPAFSPPLPSPTPPTSSPPFPSPTPPAFSPPLPSPTPPSSSPVPSPFPEWCVAKPAAPDDILQEAMDYACGAGGADCTDIRPGGACFYPDSVAAHASFAFNSYWQTQKSSGGSCDFGGAAIVVRSDPSFEGCHFGLD